MEHNFSIHDYDFTSKVDKGVGWAILEAFSDASGHEFVYLDMPVRRLQIELNKGNEFYTQSQYNNAISQYDSALSLETNYLQAHFNKGNSYYRIAEKSKDSVREDFFNKAITNFQDALMSAKNKLEKSNAFGRKECLLQKQSLSA